MLRDLLRPTAILSHLLVLAVATLCVVAGQWQLDRLQAVREHNARLEERLSRPPEQLDQLAGRDPAELEFLGVEVTGTYRPEQEVLQRNRSWRSETGFHVLTPLETTDGRVVLVRRGWVPSSVDDPPVGEAPPPAGTVEVTGILERSVDQPSFGARDPDEGDLTHVFHADVGRLDRQIDGTLFPLVLRLDGEVEDPTLDELPFPVGQPRLDERNHLSYAVQWHVFALIALAGYGAWWWSRGRRRTGPTGSEAAGADQPLSLGR